MQRVSSAHNPRLREAIRLVASSHERRRSGRCVLEGAHLVAVYLEQVGTPECVLVSEDALDRAEVQALVVRLPAARVIGVPARLFAEQAALPAGVGILAVVPAPRSAASQAFDFNLLIEDVQDPGNVGSMLRTAAAAGVGQVLLSRACAFAWSPKVLRAGQGAHFLVAIAEDVDLVAWLAGHRHRGGQGVATVAACGAELYATRLRRPLAIAIGNEGAGLSAPLRAACDTQVTIPMAPGSESLNAAAASAVLLYEALRQHQAAG